ncbi:MAG: I78 family peptidase inhibitor, partial [Tabrizicola sp.]
MRLLQALSVLAAIVMVAGCVPQGPDRMPPEPAPVDACSAAALQYLVGQPEAVLATMKFAAPTRIIQPGMAVTMDYVPERLNIWIAEGGLIERVICG